MNEESMRQTWQFPSPSICSSANPYVVNLKGKQNQQLTIIRIHKMANAKSSTDARDTNE